MLSRLHAARSASNCIARISLILMLALVLVAGLIPAGALSAAHACKMDCCVLRLPDEAGACHAFLTGITQTESAPQAEAEEHASQHQEMQMTGADDESAAAPVLSEPAHADHCRTAQPVSTRKASAPEKAQGSAERRQVVSVAQSFTAPCSEECAAAALMVVQARRPREAAALSIAPLRPRPPTLRCSIRSHFDLDYSSTERRRRIRPRAPPVSPVNLSA